MIDHVTFGVSGFARSTAFYDAAFKPLGLKRLFDGPPERTDGAPCTGYGDVRPVFWIIEQNHPGYYGAFVLDTDRHNIEAVCHEAM